MAKTLKMPFESLEWIYLAIVSDADPTALGVTVGYSRDPDDDLPPLDFVDAEWKSGGPFLTEVAGKYQKSHIVQFTASGSETATIQFPSSGTYHLWVRFSDGVQDVLRNAGKIQVT